MADPTSPSSADSPFAGKNFLILGASGGIGSVVAAQLQTQGASLAVAARNQAPLDELDLGPDTPRMTCDASKFDDVEGCLKSAVEALGSLDGVALCVGSILLKPAHLTSPAEWADVLSQNLTSAFAVVRAAGKLMRKGGSVVLCSSAAAGVGMPNHEAIAAAKGGLEALVRSAAASYAGRGLRFNAVAPGLVRTPLAAAITGNERALEQSEQMHPLGRIGEPEDIASAIVWLLNPTNTWISGDVLRVDGGLTSLRAAAKARR